MRPVARSARDLDLVLRVVHRQPARVDACTGGLHLMGGMCGLCEVHLTGGISLESTMCAVCGVRRSLTGGRAGSTSHTIIVLYGG